MIWSIIFFVPDRRSLPARRSLQTSSASFSHSASLPKTSGSTLIRKFYPFLIPLTLSLGKTQLTGKASYSTNLTGFRFYSQGAPNQTWQVLKTCQVFKTIYFAKTIANLRKKMTQFICISQKSCNFVPLILRKNLECGMKF